MVNIISYQGDTNQNHNDIALHTTMAIIKKRTSIGKNVEKLEHSHTAGGMYNGATAFKVAGNLPGISSKT